MVPQSNNDSKWHSHRNHYHPIPSALVLQYSTLSYTRFVCWVINGTDMAAFASVIIIPLAALGIILAYSVHNACRNSIKYVRKK